MNWIVSVLSRKFKSDLESDQSRRVFLDCFEHYGEAKDMYLEEIRDFAYGRNIRKNGFIDFDSVVASEEYASEDEYAENADRLSRAVLNATLICLDAVQSEGVHSIYELADMLAAEFDSVELKEDIILIFDSNEVTRRPLFSIRTNIYDIKEDNCCYTFELSNRRYAGSSENKIACRAILFSAKGNIDHILESEEFMTGIYSVVRCPVCGEAALDTWSICKECGWEYDEFDENEPDECSSCNRMTLNEARAEYRKKKSENPDYKWWPDGTDI